jgi:adenylyl-sulfate kinase
LVGAADGDGYERFRASEADADARLAEAASGRALCVWMTGLSGSGKSTISGVLSSCLRAQDVLRRGLNRDLGFTDADRSENIRRTAEVARLMVDAGLIVIVSLISPFRVDRAFARSCFAPDRFCEVFVDAPLAVCEQRDPKGLYAKARRGELARMTGIDSPYESPEQPELHLRTDTDNALECGEQVLSWLIGSGLISGRAPMAQVRVAAERR